MKVKLKWSDANIEELCETIGRENSRECDRLFKEVMINSSGETPLPNEYYEYGKLAFFGGLLLGRFSSIGQQIQAEVHGAAEKRRRATLAKALAKALEERRRQADRVLDAARADQAAYPGDCQHACARRVAPSVGRRERSVFRTIEPLFERRPLAVGHGFVKRPRRLPA